MLNPKLISTNGMDFSGSKYIAVSYRWPERFPGEAKSTRDTVREKKGGLNVSKLPQIFNDVFQVAMRMGISYVWIDSLCIIQDDPEDWNHEAALMSQIYQSAYLTVATAVSEGAPNLGLFRHGDTSEFLYEKFVCPLEDGSSEEVMVMKTQVETYTESLLISRGWCFQERELSRRIVHYTETQVLWECRTIRASEGLPNGFEPSKYDDWKKRMLDSDLGGEDVNYAWRQAVEDYSSRHLTKVTDKLPALAGLAAAIRDYKPAFCRYLAGLWEDDFVSSLAWASTPVGINGFVTNERYSEYIAPTWSWASVAGPVSYSTLRRKPSSPANITYMTIESSRSSQSGSSISSDTSLEQDANPALYKLQILNIVVQPSTADPFGAVRHAVIKCTAALVPGVLISSRVESSARFGADIMLKTTRGDNIGDMYFDVPHEEHEGDGVQVVFCIYLGVQCWMDDPGLVVLPTGKKENEYKRVGLVPQMDRTCFHSAEIKEITII